MLQPFVWGEGGQALTPEQVAARRKLAEAARGRMGDTSPVAHWSQGATRVVDALGGVLNERRADKAEAAGLASADDYIASNPVLASLIGGGSPMSPMSAPVAGPVAGPNQGIANDTMAAIGQPARAPASADAAMIRQGLVARGLPEHVADGFVLNMQDESGLNPGINEIAPLVPGSRGGFGLYQLTGPRRVAYEQFAQQRGVDPADVDAQLDFLVAELQGPESAAAREILSTQDTGSAAAAIVNKFLRPSEEHRASREARYLGGGGMSASGQPVPITGGGGDVVGALASAMSNPWVAQKYGPVIEALMDQQMRRGDAQFEQQLSQADPMRQLEMQRAQLELDQMRNPTQEPIEVGGVLLDPSTYQPIFDSRTPEAGAMPLRTPEERAAWGIPPEDTRPYAVKPGGIPQVVGGASTEITLDMNGQPRPELLGTQGLVAIPDASVPQGFRVEPAPGSPLAVEREQAAIKAAEGDRQSGIKMGTTLENINLNINEIENGGLPVTGLVGSVLGGMPGTPQADFKNRTTQINTRAALDEVQNMRDNSPTGGAVGQLTDSEREAIGLAATSLANSSSGPEYLRAAKRFREVMLDTAYGAGNWQLDANGQLVLGGAPTDTATGDEADPLGLRR